jgi:shikimate kinase
LIIYLTGFMGSGKSTLGKRLANLMGLPFIDLDAEIERQEGKSISEIFSCDGEEYFRKAESAVLRSLKTDTGAVVATGGGAPCFGSNIDFMNSTGITVYLKMNPAALASRVATGSANRPLLKGLTGDELLSYITERLNEREPWYMKSAIVFEGLNAEASELKKAIEAELSGKP